jgi:predicted GNAT family acetyltransferase
MSLAGFGSPTATGIRVGPVYTPPDRRRKGFASALVADLSRRMLEKGYEFCFLYTDLSNPYSNKVYLTIGYEFVCESADFSFTG